MALLTLVNNVMKVATVKMVLYVQTMQLFVLLNVDLVLQITVIHHVKHLIVVIDILIQMVSILSPHTMMKPVTMVAIVIMVRIVPVILLSVQMGHSNVDLVL